MTRLRDGLTALVAVAMLAGCGTTTQPKREDAFRVRHTPPGDRDVFEALLSSGGMTLTDPTCKNAGRDPGDVTVGAYLSGFLVEMNQPAGGNHLVVQHISESAESWVISVNLRHSEGEDVWSWGIELAIRKQDGTVDPRSFRCLGAG